MPQFERPGASIHYEVTGNGPPLLLIAGTASDNASWGPLIPPLSEQFRLIMIDNRGSGKGDLKARALAGRRTCGVHRVPYGHDEPHVVRPGGTGRWSLALQSQRPGAIRAGEWSVDNGITSSQRVGLGRTDTI